MIAFGTVKRQVPFRLEEELLARVERARGRVSRQQWIQGLIEEALEQAAGGTGRPRGMTAPPGPAEDASERAAAERARARNLSAGELREAGFEVQPRGPLDPPKHVPQGEPPSPEPWMVGVEPVVEKPEGLCPKCKNGMVRNGKCTYCREVS